MTAGEAATLNGKSGVQVYGGMGFTWEVDVHLYLKRAWVLDTIFGSSEEQAELLASLLTPSATATA
jgi:alkylation response protein AidB-like acyl-CoA dehydrogenase